MKKHWLMAISMALMLAVVGLCGCGAGGATLGTLSSIQLSSQQEGIWVSGNGKVMVTPDIVTLRLGIEAQEATVAEAQARAAEAMDRVMAALVDNGVAEKDIQTQYFSIRQVTKWDREKEKEIVVGYRVTNKVNVRIREIDKAGVIIDAVAYSGGDLTRIDSIGFSVDDPSAYYEEARQKAMADARTKAEQLADLGGVKLGKPTYISEGTVIPPYPRALYEKAGAVAVPDETPISPGEIEISLTVQVVYAILN